MKFKVLDIVKLAVLKGAKFRVLKVITSQR